MIPEAGQKFGPYEILGKLGGGAMGQVLRAWDARLHREVAIKLLHDDYPMPGMRERFQQEARAASGLNHPHICTIFDIGEQDGEPYMVMELLEGETLKEKILRGAVPVDEIICCAQEVADALAAAHAKGIVHRDIKPANIFLVANASGRAQAKVLDFGLAKIGLAMRGGRASRALDLTLAGATVGTLSYMSPEQARGQSLDERSDLFSLGVVMYEMATRQVPFQGATSALIFVKLLNQMPEPLHDWNDSIPKELDKIILKLLAKERDQRFQTASELSQALRKIPFRSGGGWLKRSAAAVPLVRAVDPIARVKRPMRPVIELKKGGRGVQLAVPEDLGHQASVMTVGRTSSADNLFIRPIVRSLQRGNGSKDEGVLRGDRAAVLDLIDVIIEQPSSNCNVDAEGMTALSEVLPLAVAQSVTGLVADALVKNYVEVDTAEQNGLLEMPLIAAVATGSEASIEIVEASSNESKEAVVIIRPGRKVSTSLPAEKTSKEELLKAVTGGSSKTKHGLGKKGIAAATALLTVVAGAAFLLIHSGRFQQTVLREGEPLLLTVIQNQTGDKSLDGSVMAGLELALQQSQYLAIRGGEAYQAGLRQIEAEGPNEAAVSSRRVAQTVGAKAYLYGQIRNSGSTYVINLDVLQTDSNDKLASIEQKAENRQSIPAAIGSIAKRLRLEMGEGERVIAKVNQPFEQETSANIEALAAFARGATAMQTGRVGIAIASYQQAESIDPKFVQVHMALAWLYGRERAELAAASEAKLGLDASSGSGERLRLIAQYCYEVNGSGDYNRAAGVMRQFRELYPKDPQGMVNTARLLRLQGHYPEALQLAQQSYALDPFDGEAYAEAALALIGVGRFQSALQLEDQAQRLGVSTGRHVLAAAYLSGNKELLSKKAAVIRHSVEVASPDLEPLDVIANYGLYLDNEGRFVEGAAFWNLVARRQIAATTFDGALASSRSSMFAQGALDSALAGNCVAATNLTREASMFPAGPLASFDAGMASALCGEVAQAQLKLKVLQLSFAGSSAVGRYYVANLIAAIALYEHDSKLALSALSSAAAYDQVSLTPYLRGLAHLRTKETTLAIADFTSIIQRRGAAFNGSTNVYPLAQIGLARAYDANGDRVNSKAAYQRFLEMWRGADSAQAMLIEAKMKAR